ncbi:SDR family NAD(P)-dependent oxidoreductase [Novosphingobium bradum]|uniref:SDR family NAD(P)-dependent oxidoreductase n=1 Tax=Novosphingobium bradum TaxID=1737444 RepID=A0ABV7IUI5_9SPHN
MKLLDGKSCVITGSGSGVGRQAALLFAEHGARLVCADVNEEGVARTVDEVKAAGGEAIAVRCDVSQRADVEAAVAAAVEAYGRLDVMYNNAGVSSPMHPTGATKSFLEASDVDIDRLLAINVKGVLLGCQAAIAQFEKQDADGGKRGGVIVNTASVAGMIGWGGSLYGATKGAIVNLTRALAIELGPKNIRINNVNPGTMATSFGIGANGPLPQAMLDRMATLQPLGRIIDPSEPAKAALFLASDWAINITGIQVPVDGGVGAGK